MAKNSKRSSLLGLLLAVVTIAVAVAGIVYAISTRRRHVDDAKWSDYDECGMI